MGTGMSATCELCAPHQVLVESGLAYVRYDSNSLSDGHVLIVPKRHVADFFEGTDDEKIAVVLLLDEAKAAIEKQRSPDGYNVGVNVGRAAGQSRMHVHVRLIPRYSGDVDDPRGGIRCVLARRK
jgi:diadenosine tetraphosphate (Ap4A) HIT family hydrolase